MATRAEALDGLRGFAALSVVLAHFVVFMGVLPFSTLGAMGVVVFFALSGYLIARRCWQSPVELGSYHRFLKRRFERLCPTCLAVVVMAGAALAVRGDVPMSGVLRDAAVVLSQSAALAEASGVGLHPIFLPTWSLTVEWAYYLIFPLVLLGLRRGGCNVTSCRKVLVVVALVLYGVGLLLPPALFYVLPVANLGILFAGAALATWHREAPHRQHLADNGRTTMSLLLLAILVFLPGYTISQAWKFCVVPATTLSTLVIIHACLSGNQASRVLTMAGLPAVGRRAYSLYLWHVPTMWFVWVGFPVLAPGLRALIAVPCIALVTTVSFRYLEAPRLSENSRQPGRGVRRRKGRSRMEVAP